MATGSVPRTLLLLLLSAVSCPAADIDTSKIDPLVVQEQLLWVRNLEGEVNTFRVPLITYTPNGSLLAFVEGRKMSERDTGSKFISMKRSVDKGVTWSASYYILDDGIQTDGLNLGSVVVDDAVGIVFLIYTTCFHQCPKASTMMIQSNTDGLSWSMPRNLSREIGLGSFAPGPGTGLQKRYQPYKGRLLVCGHGTIEGDGVFCIFSDDHGNTWKPGASMKSIPYNQKKKPQDFNPDECQPVELNDGSILINTRNQNNYHCRCRIVMRSMDGGTTLPIEYLTFDENLVDPAVAAGAVQKDGVLYFVNPADAFHRVNLTLRWSLTQGKSWEKQSFQLWGQASGYSCMTSLDSDSANDHMYIYVLYEKGHDNYDDTISFMKILLFSGLKGT